MFETVYCLSSVPKHTSYLNVSLCITKEAEQDPDLPLSASNVLGYPTSPLFNKVAGQVEVPAGPVNFRGSCPRSENDVLQPMLHPAYSTLGYTFF